MKAISELAHELNQRMEAGESGVFGITRHGEDDRLVLITRRRAYPILLLRLELEAEGQHLVMTSQNWQGQLIIEAQEATSLQAQMAFMGETLLLDTAANSFIGSLTVVASPNTDRSKLFALDANFFVRGDEPQSSVLWDTAPEMVHHWHTAILRGSDGNGLGE